ncbi:hypothetical protein CHUAL_000225 [Chamberlinius hualienensis]
MCISVLKMGGCVSSGELDDVRHRSNVFHVWNVNEYGEAVSPGQMEVTDSSLILYQKASRETIIWPMRSLRRYGFDAQLFSFESGRRCTTGAGVYAFKCRKAEILFNMLQERILSSGQDELSNHSAVNNINPVNLPPNDTETDNYLQPILINPSNSTHNYVNEINNVEPTVEQQLKSAVTSNSLDDETNYAKLDDLLKQEHQHLYMNVTVADDQPSASSSTDVTGEQYSCDHCYANVAPSAAESQTLTTTTTTTNNRQQVNYAILDLRRRSRNKKNNNNNNNTVLHKAVNLSVEEEEEQQHDSTADQSLCLPNNNLLEGYAKIDFDKTTALSNSINPTLDDDQAVRKTRHNSNASSMLNKRTSLAIADSTAE